MADPSRDQLRRFGPMLDFDSEISARRSSRLNMLKRQFGSTGVSVPVIGQGTWQMESSGVAAMDLGIELGMTHIDTAEMYTGSEELVAEVIRDRREKIFLVSKVLPSNTSYKNTLR